MLKTKYQVLYGKLAVELGSVSQCNRLKVGAFLIQVVDGIPSIVSDGVNGLPSGDSNCCEDNEGRTVDGVRHAEVAAIKKMQARCGDFSTVGLSLVVSDSPCPECAERIVEAGINCVYYVRPYRKSEGIDILKRAGIHVEKVDLNHIVVTRSKPKFGSKVPPNETTPWHASLRTTLESIAKIKGKKE